MKYFLKFLFVLIVLILSCNFVCADSIYMHSVKVRKIIYSKSPAWLPLAEFEELSASTSRIEALLKSTSAAERAKAAFLLGQIANPSSAKTLKAALKDSDRKVRIQAGIALALMGDISGKGICRTALSTEPDWIRYYAICGLWSIKDNSYLKNNINNQTDFIKATIQYALKTKQIEHINQKVKEPNICQFLKLKELWEDSSGILIKESDIWWHKGNFEQVIRCSKAAIFMDPADAETYGDVAWLEWSAGRDEDAQNTLKHCIKNNPNNPDAYFEFGYHYYHTDRYALAENPLQTSVNLGGDILSRKFYAHCLEKLGKTKESLDEWEKILKDHPKNATIIKNYERVKNMVQKQDAP